MKKTICIVNGKPTCGKDTIVSMVAKKFKVRNTDSVMPVKNAAITLGWDGVKSEENRLFLSELKKLSDRHFNTSFKHVAKGITCFLRDEEEEVMFIHIREPHNIGKILDYIETHRLSLTKDNWVDVHTLFVTNPNVSDITTNSSDRGVSNYDYDYWIENDGTLDDLQLKVDLLIEEWDL